MPNMLREMCGEPISTPALPNASAESRSHEPTSFALERQAILPTESPLLPSCLHRAPERTCLVAQWREDDGISDLRTATKSAMRIGGPEPKIWLPTTTQTCLDLGFDEFVGTNSQNFHAMRAPNIISRAAIPNGHSPAWFHTRVLPSWSSIPASACNRSPTDRTETSCDLETTFSSSKCANKSSPSCNWLDTSQSASWMARLNKRGKRVPLFPSLVLLNPVPLSLAINPRITRQSRVGSPHKWQQLPKPRHLMQFGHDRTSTNMVIRPNPVNGKNGQIRLSFGDGPDHMANAVRTGSGGASKLERSARFFWSINCLTRVFATKRRNEVLVAMPLTPPSRFCNTVIEANMKAPEMHLEHQLSRNLRQLL